MGEILDLLMKISLTSLKHSSHDEDMRIYLPFSVTEMLPSPEKNLLRTPSYPLYQDVLKVDGIHNALDP